MEISEQEIEQLNRELGGRIAREVLERMLRDEKTLKIRYSGQLPPLSPVGEIHRQQNNWGMNTCTFASAENALHSLLGNRFDPIKYSERALLEAVGGEQYARTHQTGSNLWTANNALEQSLRGTEFITRGSDSLPEILQEVENGAAAIVPFYIGGPATVEGTGIPGHVGTILPGSRVRRNPQGNLEVQIIDPLSGTATFRTIEQLIRNAGLSGVSDPFSEGYRPALIIKKSSVRVPQRGPQPVTAPAALEAEAAITEEERWTKTLLANKARLASIFTEGQNMLFHATQDIKNVRSILTNGLHCDKRLGLNGVAAGLKNIPSGADQKTKDQIVENNLRELAKPHRGYRYEVIIELPQLTPEQKADHHDRRLRGVPVHYSTYYIQPLSRTDEMRNFDAVLPPQYIKGFLDLETGEFIARTPGQAPSTPQTLEAEAAVSLEKSVISGVGFSEAQGNRSTMEDAHTMIEKFGGKPNQAFFAIYDGHGGRQVADFVKDRLHTNLLRHLNSGVAPQEALKMAYEETDRQIQNTNAGATAVTAFIRGRKLFIANAGDARAVLNRDGIAVRLSYDHKPTDPEEMKRIIAAGGTVRGGYIEKADKSGVAVARAFGDKDFKPMVTAEPYIAPETDLFPPDNFLILACDGVWDVMNDQEAVDLIKNEPDPQRASELLKNEALRRAQEYQKTNPKFGDNISVMVVKLNPPGA